MDQRSRGWYFAVPVMGADGANLWRLAGGPAGSRYVERVVGGCQLDIAGIDIVRLNVIAY
ncbi:MAG TPA: hypothetical protein VMX96_03690 [Dehalococcoidia bacterium]|nr:hypothetical protein [Dehalococcoidia bacterium]